MGKATRQINRISGRVIYIAVRLILIAVVVFLIIRGIAAAYRFGHSIFYAGTMESAPGRDISVTIDKGSDAKSAAEVLKKNGLIDNEWAFRIQARFYGMKIKAGTYKMNTSQTIKEMLEILDTGTTDTSAQNTGSGGTVR
jgi:cell division protein YceG involved in septum cleavage